MLLENPNNLNVGMRCIKYMIFTINFMFVLTGALLIVVGITINAMYDHFEHFLYDHFYSPPTMLIVIGILILLISFFGCVGAIKESACWINVYGFLLFLVLLLQVSAAISAYALQGQVHNMVIKTINDSMHQYQDDEYVRETIDYLQMSLECCGIESPSEWNHILHAGENTSRLFVPASCCGVPFTTNTDNCELPYTDGCYYRLKSLISQGSNLIATGATAVALVQMLGVICAFMLSKAIRQTKSLREAKRYQLQQSLAILPEPYYSIADEVTDEKIKQEYEKIYKP